MGLLSLAIFRITGFLDRVEFMRKKSQRCRLYAVLPSTEQFLQYHSDVIDRYKTRSAAFMVGRHQNESVIQPGKG